MYVMKEEAGALSSDRMDRNKVGSLSEPIISTWFNFHISSLC